MKKFVSMLLAVALLASMLTVFAVPASAEDEPMECPILYNSVTLDDGGKYVISQSCDLVSFDCWYNTTLIIEKDAVVTVSGQFYLDSDATLIIRGTLDLSNADNSECNGTIHVACCGTLISGGYSPAGYWVNATILDDGHDFSGGVCRVCNYECKHERYSCDTCGEKFVMGITSGGEGSTLSEGNLAIITAVAGIAVGLVGGLVIGKKKQSEAIHNS